MDIWIIEDGEKRGPLPDFEVRRRIQSGEFRADTPAWHEGLDGWKILGKMPLFEREFEDLKSAKEQLPATPASTDQPPGPGVPPPLPAKPALARRFWARWFDLSAYAAVWWLAMAAVGQDIGAVLSNPWIILFHYVPWFVCEAILLHRFGTTPGKWLLGLRVINADGSSLTLPQATRRSWRVLFIGIGMGWGYLALICQVIAFFATRRFGRPVWDHAGGHQTTQSPLVPLRIAAFVVLFFISVQLRAAVIMPHILKVAAETFPELREEIEKMPAYRQSMPPEKP